MNLPTSVVVELYVVSILSVTVSTLLVFLLLRGAFGAFLDTFGFKSIFAFSRCCFLNSIV